MFERNLKYYRLKNNLTKKELASRVGVSAMSITHYENGDRYPDMDIIKKLASALGVSAIDFIASRNLGLQFEHERFRKNSKLSVLNQTNQIPPLVSESRKCSLHIPCSTTEIIRFYSYLKVAIYASHSLLPVIKNSLITKPDLPI